MENQGWNPPQGWVPLEGAPPAPRGWIFWTLDGRDAETYFAPVVQKMRNRALIWILVAVAGFIVSMVSISSSSNGGGYIFWGAVVFGIYYSIKSLADIPKVKQEIFAEFTSKVSSWKNAVLRDEYNSNF